MVMVSRGSLAAWPTTCPTTLCFPLVAMGLTASPALATLFAAMGLEVWKPKGVGALLAATRSFLTPILGLASAARGWELAWAPGTRFVAMGEAFTVVTTMPGGRLATPSLVAAFDLVAASLDFFPSALVTRTFLASTLLA